MPLTGGHPSDEALCVYTVFEMGGPQDDYRAFSYVDRIRETLPASARVSGQILGAYSGPRLAQGQLQVRGSRREGLAPHRMGWARLWRYIQQRRGRTPVLHWFSSLEGRHYTALRWMRGWTRSDAKAILFAQNLHSALKLVELVFLSAPAVPHGITVVLLGADGLDSLKIRRLRQWGVVLLLDADAPTGADALSKSLRTLDFRSIEEMPLQARKAPSVNWCAELRQAVLLERNPEKVVFVRPDWMKCGSATTFGKLSKLFQDRGAILIDVALQPYRVPCDRHLAAEKIREVVTDLDPAFHFNLRRSMQVIAWIKIGWYYLINQPKTVAGYMPVFYMQCDAPSVVRQFFKGANIDYLYVNHYFSLPFARELVSDRPVFLDTHDVQSLNYVSHDYHHQIRRRAAPFSACFKEELAIVDRADRVTMVSRDEIDLVKKFRPDGEYFYYLPLPSISAAGQFSENYDRRPVPNPRMRLLVVAARNPANERSLRWFLSAIWPSICRLGVELNIVGAISKSFEGESFPATVFHGLVDDIKAFYDSIDLVVLPITNGGGIAIKTLESIMLGLPLVATRHAVRGLPEGVVKLLPNSVTDEEFLADLLCLITEAGALERRKILVAQARKQLLIADFDRQMHRELDLMRPSLPARQVPRQVLPRSVDEMPRFVLVPPASPGSKGDEGMIRGALNVLSGAQIVILNPDPAPSWLEELNRDGKDRPLVQEVAGPLLDYADQLSSTDVLIVLGADVIDGTCGVEPSVRRLKLVSAALACGARAYVFCSFRSKVDEEIIRRIDDAKEARFFLRDPVSWDNFRKQLEFEAEEFPDFFSYCDRRESSEVVNYKKLFDQARSGGHLVVALNANEHAFRSFFDEHTDANRRLYVSEMLKAILAARSAVHLTLVSNDSRSAETFPSDAAYQNFAAEWLAENAPNTKFLVANPEISYPEILSLLEGVDLVVTGRMHLALASFRAGVLPIILMGTDCRYTSVEKMRGAHVKYLGAHDFVVSRYGDLTQRIQFYLSFQDAIVSTLKIGSAKSEEFSRSKKNDLMGQWMPKRFVSLDV